MKKTFQSNLKSKSSNGTSGPPQADHGPVEYSGLRDEPRSVANGQPGPTKPLYKSFSSVLNVSDISALSFTRDQTFGIEIELTTEDYDILEPDKPCWWRLARQILGRLRKAAHLTVADEPEEYHSFRLGDYRQWRVAFDNTCGFEVISPVLVNEEGVKEAVRVCQALTSLTRKSSKLYVDGSCGLHVTLAHRLARTRLQRFFALVTRLEPGLFTLAHPSRLYKWKSGRFQRGQRNRYCPPIREAFRDTANLDKTPRAHCWASVGVRPTRKCVQLLEVRMLHGTLDYREILPWISLWMKIIEHASVWKGQAEGGRVFQGGNRVITPRVADREDVFKLLANEGIVLTQGLEEALRKQRANLKSEWARVLPKRVLGWETAGWYEEPSVAINAGRKFQHRLII